MYSVNFIFRNSSVTQGFVFKKEKDARDLVMRTSKPMALLVVADDDYGCHATINCSDVCAVVINDVAREYEKANEFRKLEQQSLQAVKYNAAGMPNTLVTANQCDGRKL